MEYTFKCANCGKEIIRNVKRPERPRAFCCYTCAAKWRVDHGQYQMGFTMENRGTLPYDDVKIRVTKDLDLFPDYRPKVGDVYKAERYQGQNLSKVIGYVIAVNGHRVNIRQNECVEV